MLAIQGMILQRLARILSEEKGDLHLDFAVLTYVGLVFGLLYFYLSGSSTNWFWHDVLMLVNALRF